MQSNIIETTPGATRWAKPLNLTKHKIFLLLVNVFLSADHEQGADAAGGKAPTSPRPFTAPVGSSASPLHRLATLPHLLSQPSEMPASWNTPPTPSSTQPKSPAAVEEAAPWHKLAQQEAAMQDLQAKQAQQEQLIQGLQTDVARCAQP